MVTETATRYPLAWPVGWKRTVAYQRQRAAFKTRGQNLTVAAALSRLSGELSRLGARQELLSTNVAVRLDGLPYSNQAEPNDSGAAVYFKLKGQDRCLACDRWNRVADNIAAIAQHIDALRRIDRYGVGTMEQAFAGYTALPMHAGSDWPIVLGVKADAPLDVIEAMFRELSRTAHPDAGGSHEAMVRLTEARAAARLARGAV